MLRSILILLILAPLAHAATLPAELATAVLPSPLHSRAGAFAISYLDFDRYPSTATDAQKSEIWRLVGAAFSPFNIDVTNADPGPRANVMWCVIGGPLMGTTAGEAGVGTWTQGTLFEQYGTVFSASVFADGLGNDPDYVAFAIIHEDLHLLGIQEHETTGYMVANIDPSQAFFTPQDVAFIGGQTGFAPVPEPSVLLAVAVLFLWHRPRRGHFSLTLRNDLSAAILGNWPANVSPIVNLPISANPVKNQITRIGSRVSNSNDGDHSEIIPRYPLMRRQRRHHQRRPASEGTTSTVSMSSSPDLARACCSLSAVTKTVAGDSCPHPSTLVPSTLYRGITSLMRFLGGAHKGFRFSKRSTGEMAQC